MSKNVSISPAATELDESDDESWLEAHREQLELEANSDAPDAWVFERLLQSLDAEDGD